MLKVIQWAITLWLCYIIVNSQHHVYSQTTYWTANISIAATVFALPRITRSDAMRAVKATVSAHHISLR